MRNPLIPEWTIDTGDSLDRDLNNMSDDGCSNFPDPDRVAAIVLHDNLGLWNTLDGLAEPAGSVQILSKPTTGPRSRWLRCRCGQTELRST